MKKLVKLLLFVSLNLSLLLNVSCSLGGDANVQRILKNYENSTSLKVSSAITCNDKLASNRTSYIALKDNKVNSYSTIKTESSIISSYKKYDIKEYSSGNDICYQIDSNNSFTTYENNSILGFLGFTSIFEDAKTKSLMGNSVSGSISADKCDGIIRSLLVDQGITNDHPSNYYYKNSISYQMIFNLDTDSIISLNLNLYELFDKKFSSVNKLTSSVVFELTDVNSVLTSNPFPSNGQGGGSGSSTSSNEEKIKQKGIDFINDCYEEIEYVYDDLYFYTNCIESAKLSFKYESNKPNVLGNDGKYYNVSVDTEVTLSVSLFYSQVQYKTLSFTFLVTPKPSQGNGDLGSPTNPLYKGRKAIETVDIYFIEMVEEYGDAIYIQAGDFDMLIDAGQSSDGSNVNDVLRRHISDGILEMVVATHAHGDHIGGMLTALSTVKNITYAVDYGYDRSDYSTVNQVRNKFKTADKYYPITDCIDNKNGARKVLYITDELYITFLDTTYYLEPGYDTADYYDYNANLTSVTFIMTYKNQNYYFAGDLESEGESAIVRNGEAKKVNLAKASHHGSATSSTTSLLSKLDAEVTVISAALVDRGSEDFDAKWQPHPNKSVFNSLTRYSDRVYCNYTTGTLKVTCDGNSSIVVEGQGPKKPYYMNGVAVSGEQNLEFKNTKYGKRHF